MDVSLRKVTRDNYEQVLELKLTYKQQRMLSPNSVSLVEYHYHQDTHVARAVYANETVVGFIMWAVELPDEAIIFRFMIDEKWQNKGTGRKALLLAVDEIKSHDGIEEIAICYSESNSVAKKLYFLSLIHI